MSRFPRMDILPATQRTLWPQLADVTRFPFVLFDVDALLQSGLSLSAGLAGAQCLFQTFSPQECLKALTWFEDEALAELPAPAEERLIAAVKAVRSIPGASLAATTLSD